MPKSSPVRARSSTLRRALRSRWLHPLNDVVAIDQLIGQVHPLWSLRQVRARVLQVIDETADTRSYVLQANSRWSGHRAGQHVLLRHQIDGVGEQRCYSLSTATRPGRQLTITVKRQPEGRMSNRLHAELQPGQIVELGQAEGDFVLPEQLPARILLLSAGSGITPMRALLGELRLRGFDGEIVLLHSCRGEHDFIFGAELRALAAQWPALRVMAHDSSSQGRLDRSRVQDYIADFLQWPTWACGPAALLAELAAAYRAAGSADRLRTESFGGVMAAASGSPGLQRRVRCLKTEQSFTAADNAALLGEAEAAGLEPRYGCRRGICRSCVCKKRSGSVENLLTGAISAQPDQWIQLCISAARSDLELEL